MLKFKKNNDFFYVFEKDKEKIKDIRIEHIINNDLTIFKTNSIQIEWSKDNYIKEGIEIYSKKIIDEYMEYNQFKDIKLINQKDLVQFIINNKKIIKYIPIDNEKYNYLDLKKRTIVFVSNIVCGTGGINQIYSNLSKIFSDKGYDVKIWGTFKKDLREEYIDEENVFFYTDNKYYKPITEKIKKEIKNYNEPIFILSGSIIYGALIDYISEYVVINQYHSSIVTLLKNYQLEEARYTNIEKFISDGYRRDLLLFLSKKESDLIQSISSEPVDYIYNYSKIDENVNSNENKEDLVWVGRMESQAKNFNHIIEIALRIKKENIKKKIYVYSIIDKEIEKQIKDLKINHIIILMGYESDKKKIYKNKKNILLTSYYEGTPLIVLEAIANGVVPITYNSSFFLDEYFKNKKEIILVSDLDEIIDVIKKDEKNNIDIKSLKNKYKEVYDSEYVFNSWINIIEKAIKNRSKKKTYESRDQITLLKKEIRKNIN